MPEQRSVWSDLLHGPWSEISGSASLFERKPFVIVPRCSSHGTSGQNVGQGSYGGGVANGLSLPTAGWASVRIQGRK